MSIDDRNFWNERNEEFAPAPKWNPEADGWTKEVTQQRRDQWNARAKAGEFSTKGKTDMLKVQAAWKAQGWTTNTLKLAIDYYNL